MAEILAYVHKEGFFHRLHPVTKMLFILVFGLMSILSTNLGFLAYWYLRFSSSPGVQTSAPKCSTSSALFVIMSVILIGITVITMPAGRSWDTLFLRIPGHWRQSVR